MDFHGLLYGPVYKLLGVPATLTIGGQTFSITALDKSAGVVVGGAVEVQTILPAAVVLARDLADLGAPLDLLDTGTIALNGKTWRIASHRPMPSPSGESDGEVYLILEGEE